MSFAADVVVVGGGPAGTAAAIWAALGGLRVALLEKSSFPRHRPGETLHPGVISIFRQLGVEKQVEAASTIRHSGHRVIWGGRELLTEFGADEQGPWLGYQILRAKLDSILIDRAREVGVNIAQPDAVNTAIVEGLRVVGVRTSETIFGRFIIDAAGSQGWLRRQLGLSIKTASPSLRAYYGYCEGELEEPSALPSLIADEHGWTWTAKVGPRQFHWTRLDFTHRGRSRHLPAAFQSLRQTDSIRSADVTWRCVQSAAGRGYFIAGDAAVVLDPAASHGVLRALMSGIMAAHAVRQIMTGAIEENSAALQYCVWLNEWFQHDLSYLSGLYLQLKPPPIWLPIEPVQPH